MAPITSSPKHPPSIQMIGLVLVAVAGPTGGGGATEGAGGGGTLAAGGGAGAAGG